MIWHLAQTIDPTDIGDKLSQAQSVQQVLSVVVMVLMFALMTGVVFHIRESRRWETKTDEKESEWEAKIEKKDATVLKTWKKVERAISALAGLPMDDEED